MLEPAVDLRKGFYGDATLVGAFHPTLDDFDRLQRTPYGLPPLWTSFYAYARGESGRHWFPMRTSQARHSPRLSLTSTLGWEGALDAPEARATYRGYTEDFVADGVWTITPSLPRPGQAMSFQLEPGGKANWVEEGVLALSFDSLGPASQLYYPDPVYDLYMMTLLFRVGGTVAGEVVDGIGVVEMAWGTGMCDYREMPMTLRGADQFMLNVIEYADGGAEHAVMHPAFGPEGGGGTLWRDGELTRLYGVRSAVELDERQEPALVRWTCDGLAWEADITTASLASPRSPGWHWHCGTSRPTDVDREVAWSFCFAEVLPRAMRDLRAQA